MKKAIALVLAVTAFGSAAHADKLIGGYFTKRGTYVAPHYRSNADRHQSNNYSYKGNYNPYTGHIGTHPYRQRSTNYGGASRGVACPAYSWC